MLDIDQIRQLVDMMVVNDLVEISIRNGEDEINLRRPNCSAGVVMTAPAPAPAAAPVVAAPAPLPAPVDDKASEAGLVEIGSPMVGTFYASPEPNAPPFVQVGSAISPGTVVCIIEAMKVFNEIKSEVAGKIERVLAKSGSAVEYGQPLFLVRAS